MLDDNTIRAALAAMGERLRLNRDVEILIVGGAAGVLTGVLPAAWTTADVDVLHVHLPQDREAVFSAAVDACRTLSLPPSWMSEDVRLYAWTLPEDWQSRRVRVGVYGRLHVYAVSRRDLAAMKFCAHRAADLEHLAQLHLTAADLRFVRTYLAALSDRYPEYAGQIAMARQYVEEWEAQT